MLKSDKLRENRHENADGHESNPEHLLNAESTYLELAERFNWRHIDCAPDKTLGSLKTIDAIAEEVYSSIQNRIDIILKNR
ncbi:MAG: hypothetical protein AABX07_05915 [Nanoarchaeota archaeon]